MTTDTHGIWMRFVDYTPEDASDRPRVTLVPEHHQHEVEFAYEQRHEYWRHDHLFLEGVAAPGAGLFRALSRTFKRSFGFHAYRRARGAPRPRITRSGQLTVHCSARKGAVIPWEVADLDRAAWRAKSRELSWAARARSALWLGAMMLAFLLALPARLFVSSRRMRRFMIRLMHCDCGDAECAGSRGPLDSRELGDDLLTRARDEHLASRVREFITDPGNASRSLCVGYGAGHMPMLHDLLTETGYEVSQSRDVLCVAAPDCALDDAARGWGVACREMHEAADAADRETWEEAIHASGGTTVAGTVPSHTFAVWDADYTFSYSDPGLAWHMTRGNKSEIVLNLFPGG